MQGDYISIKSFSKPLLGLKQNGSETESSQILTSYQNIMKEWRELGIIQFEGDEEAMATRWMWACLTDLTWKGKVEVIWRVLLGRKPKWIYDDPARKV